MAASRGPEQSFCLLLASKQATRIIRALQRTLLRVMEDGLNCSSRDCHFIANFLCRVGLGFAPPEPRSSGQGRKHLFQILMNRDRSNMWIRAKLCNLHCARAFQSWNLNELWLFQLLCSDSEWFLCSVVNSFELLNIHGSVKNQISSSVRWKEFEWAY
jgi:hypothetical protein